MGLSPKPQRVTRAYIQPSPESGFLSRRQVSREYGFSVSYLASLPRTDLWFHKVGNKVFYERQDVVAFIRGQKHESLAAEPLSRRGRPPKPILKDDRKAATAAGTR